MGLPDPTDRQMDILVVDKLQKKTVVIDVAISSDNNIMKKENKEFEKIHKAEGGS